MLQSIEAPPVKKKKKGDDEPDPTEENKAKKAKKAKELVTSFYFQVYLYIYAIARSPMEQFDRNASRICTASSAAA